jgi:hypothetical protein
MKKKLTSWEKQVKKEGGLEAYWTNQAKKLVGKTITGVRYLSREETLENYWERRPIGIELDNEYWIVPKSDDEGNEGGGLDVHFMKDIKSCPTLSVNDKYLES